VAVIVNKWIRSNSGTRQLKGIQAPSQAYKVGILLCLSSSLSLVCLFLCVSLSCLSFLFPTLRLSSLCLFVCVCVCVCKNALPLCCVMLNVFLFSVMAPFWSRKKVFTAMKWSSLQKDCLNLDRNFFERLTPGVFTIQH